MEIFSELYIFTFLLMHDVAIGIIPSDEYLRNSLELEALIRENRIMPFSSGNDTLYLKICREIDNHGRGRKANLEFTPEVVDNQRIVIQMNSGQTYYDVGGVLYCKHKENFHSIWVIHANSDCYFTLIERIGDDGIKGLQLSFHVGKYCPLTEASGSGVGN